MQLTIWSSNGFAFFLLCGRPCFDASFKLGYGMSGLCYFAPFLCFFFFFLSLSFFLLSFFLCSFGGVSGSSKSLPKRPPTSKPLSLLSESTKSKSAASFAAPLDGAEGMAGDGASGARSVSVLHLRRRLGAAGASASSGRSSPGIS